MKKLFINLILIGLFAVGCVTTPVCVCPPEDVLIGVPIAPGMDLPVGIPKGMFDQENKYHLWVPLKDIKKMITL